jgi:hypothetical protein
MSDRALPRALKDDREPLLDYARGLTERQREHLARMLAANLPSPSPAEVLEELERDVHANRHLKWDLRVAADEKIAWAEAARVRGISQSEWARDVLNAAAREILVNAR